MKRKDWLLLVLAVVLIGGIGFGMLQYRMSHQPSESPQIAEGAAEPTAQGGPAVQLWITRDFGAQTLTDQRVPLEPGDTVMDILKRHGGDVKTAYGGGFVESIQGLASAYRPGDEKSRKLDWFYSVNGLMADVGAAEYALAPGDVVWWDYHDWSFAAAAPAQVGAYPQPFVQMAGKAGVDIAIMAEDGYDGKARQVADSLEKMTGKAPQVIGWDESAFRQEKAMLVIGEAKQLAASPFLQTLWKDKASSGLFAAVSDRGIQAYDEHGKAGRLFDQKGAGAILATVHPEFRLPLWIAAGVGAEGVDQVVQALSRERADQPDNRIRRHFGLIVNGNETIPLPLPSGAGGAP
jgi:hypothetical protein